MIKLLLLVSALVALTVAGGAGDVDDDLLARVAQLIDGEDNTRRGFARGFENDRGFQGREQTYLSEPSNSYGAPAPIRTRLGRFRFTGYAPTNNGYTNRVRQGRFGSGVEIGRPERANRVAEFDLEGGGNNNFRRCYDDCPQGVSRGYPSYQGRSRFIGNNANAYSRYTEPISGGYN